MTKSQSIHEVFEECLELVINGESIEECLHQFPEYAGELKGLLETATAARKSMAVQPSIEFRQRARLQLQTALRAQAIKPQRTGFLNWNWQSKWAVATASVLVLLVMGSGAVLAADKSMPDQPLYAVKQATEWFRLSVTTSPTAKAELNATLADRRINEIVYLAAKGNAEELTDTVERLSSNLVQISNIAVSNEKAVFSTGRDMYNLTAPQSTANIPVTESNDSQTASEELPPVTLAQPSPASRLSPNVNKAAGNTTWSNIEVVVPPNASKSEIEHAKLVAWIKHLAVQHPALLREALANVPDETRTALLKAIAVSETGYEKVLQSLETMP
jgi:hypothetical protein